MKLHLRWKITLAFTLLAAAVFLLLDVSLQMLVTRQGQELMQENLLNEARLAARVLPPPPWHANSSLQGQALEIDHLDQARLTLIDPSGRVLADSRDNPANMENHATRPEIVRALAAGWGAVARHSRTEGMDMLYVAVSLRGSDASSGWIVRLARPMTQVRAASQRLREAIWLGFAIAVAMIWFVGLALSNTLTAPIERLVRAARRVDAGDLQARVEGVHGPDVGELARVFNSAVDSLSRMVSQSQRESRYYAAILEQMTDAVIIIDRTGSVQFINPTFARLFGLHNETVEGRTSEEIALNYDLSALLMRAVKQEAVQREEVRLLYPAPRVLATAATPLLDDESAVAGAIGLLRDVTDLHRMDEVRREFVANASHELRTPAASVKALAEALQMGALKDPERGPRFVQQIVEAADRQGRLLDDMLTLTRVERGRELLQVASIDAAAAFEDAARQIRPSAEAKGVRLTVEVAAGDRLLADANGLHTILLNLLDNAVKYTSPAGQVTLRGAGVPGGYELTVADTGLGIPPEDQSRIFERFYRVDRARDRATGGTGLGLSIVKHLTEAHGGRVGVRSTLGEGSVFTVFLPDGGAAAPKAATQ